MAAVPLLVCAQEGPGPAASPGGSPLEPARSGLVAGPSGGPAGVAGVSNAVPDLAALSRHLVGHWTLDEQHGLRAVDASGKGNHGTLFNFPRNNSHWVSGRIRGGLNFNSSGISNNVVTVPDSAVLNFTNGLSFTLSVWVRSLGPQVSAAGILCKGFGMGGEQFGLDVFEGKFRFYTRPAQANPASAVISAVAPNGRWQHLTATFDRGAGRMSLYVDGQWAGAKAAPPTLLYSTHEVSIGCRKSSSFAGYDLGFKGLIDDVRIYDCALNAAEVEALHTAAGTWPLVLYHQPKGASRHVGERVEFAVAADGTGPIDFQWQKNGQDLPEATASALELGDLRFEDAGVYTVKLADANGTLTSTNAVLTMVPYFWQTRWFLLLGVPLLLLGVAGAVYLVETAKRRRAVARLEQAHAIDEERMRIARDMHDEIGSKLSRVAFLSDMARQTVPETSTARRQIDEVSEAARDIVQAVDEIVWAVNPRHDTLESLVQYIRSHTEEFFEMTTMELEFEQPPDLPACQLSAEVRHNLFCAVKEALNNVLKHAGATRVRLSFDLGEATFRIAVVDNGCGFDPQAVSAAGNGLFNIRERLKGIRGTWRFDTRPGGGTTVVLSVPLTPASQPEPA
jgi:signal transduction histidine kinase